MKIPQITWGQNSLESLGPVLWLAAFSAVFTGIRIPDWVQHALLGTPHGGTVWAPAGAAIAADHFATDDRVKQMDDAALPAVNAIVRPLRRLWTGSRMLPLRSLVRRQIFDPSNALVAKTRRAAGSDVGHLVGGALIGAGYWAAVGGNLPLVLAANAGFRSAMPYVDDRLHAHDVVEDSLEMVGRLTGKGTRRIGRFRRKFFNLSRVVFGGEVKNYADNNIKRALKQFAMDPKAFAPEYEEPPKGWHQRFRKTRVMGWVDEILGDANVGERERQNLARVLQQFTRAPLEIVKGENPWDRTGRKWWQVSAYELKRLPKKLAWEGANLIHALRSQKGAPLPEDAGIIHESDGATAIATALFDAQRSAVEIAATDRVLELAESALDGDRALLVLCGKLFAGVSFDELHRVIGLGLADRMHEQGSLNASDRKFLALSLVRSVDQLDQGSSVRLIAHLQESQNADTSGELSVRMLRADCVNLDWTRNSI